MEEKEKFYITTSIPYLNGPPHLGHALEFVEADAIARHMRLFGKDVFFLTGSDEHGATIIKAAEKAQKTPKEFIDNLLQIFQDLLKKLNISNDDFIRTSDEKRHWPGAQLLWEKLVEAGDIYKGFYKGFYCVGHEAFVTDKDLKDGLCILHKKRPELIEEENYFFKLSKYAEKIKDKILTSGVEILPEFRKLETINMLGEIGDISFSRPSKDISWGIPVPGDATQTMYVWCDALSNYITALGFGSLDDTKFKKYWPADLHVIGKDITKFHTIFWLGMLMSAGLPLPSTIFIHGFIDMKGEKMSKTVGNVINPFPLIEKYGRDAVRIYLLNQISTFGDSDYSDEHFADFYEGSLVNGLGNLLARVVKMMSAYPAISKPEETSLGRYPIRKNLDFLNVSQKSVSIEEISPSFLADNFIRPEYEKFMSRYELSQASEKVFMLLHRLDEYIEEYKPYKMAKTDPEGIKIILWHLAYSLASSAWMLKPFMPETSNQILSALGVDSDAKEEWKEFRVKEVVHLFPRIKK